MRGGSQEEKGSQLYQMIQMGEGKADFNTDHPRSLENHSAVSAEWKRQSQQMSFPDVHFKSALETISRGDAVFTLVILY